MLLSNEQQAKLNRYIQNWLQDLQESGRGKMAAVSKKTGVTPTHITNIRQGKAGVGPETLEKFASLAFELTDKELVARAEAWCAANPEPAAVGTVREYTDRYPNRTIAVMMARTSGYPEDAIQMVLGKVLDSDNDLTSEDWFEDIKHETRKLKGKIKTAPAPVEAKRGTIEAEIEEAMAMSDEEIAANLKRSRR